MEYYFRCYNISKLKIIFSFSEYLNYCLKIPLTLIDSYYYGQLVITPFNHIRYNLFSKHGPTLYGKLNQILQ